MKSNGLLKWLMIPVAVLLVLVAMRLFSGGHPRTAARDGAGSQLTPEEMKALGIEGDTPRDTVATLVGQVKQMRSELQTALTDNRSQKAENDRLRQRETDIDQRVQNALSGEHERLQQERSQVDSTRQQTQGMLQDVEQRLDGMGHKNGQADLPVGLGLHAGDGQGLGDGDTTWVDPGDAPAKARGTAGGTSGAGSPASFPTSFGTGSDPGRDMSAASVTSTDDAASQPSATPVYTVPANATLMGSVAMTALIGRVAVDGTVNDPYPFKVLIGPDNLTANGIDLPDVAGAVVSGTASGDWTLSCVRGQIRSITFVFHDGTIRTIPDPKGQNVNAGTSQVSTNGSGPFEGGLGWISDPWGVPCVSGARRSNAAQYLGSQALITAAGAGAAALIPKGDNSFSYVSGSNGTSLGTVGISGNEAMGEILAGGVQSMSQWVNKLYGQAFAAIYVPPGAKVAVHIDQPLNIDYDPKGRKVNYRTGGSDAADLD